MDQSSKEKTVVLDENDGVTVLALTLLCARHVPSNEARVNVMTMDGRDLSITVLELIQLGRDLAAKLGVTVTEGYAPQAGEGRLQ